MIKRNPFKNLKVIKDVHNMNYRKFSYLLQFHTKEEFDAVTISHIQ